MLLCAFCTIPPNTLVLQIVFLRYLQVSAIIEKESNFRLQKRKTVRHLAFLRAFIIRYFIVECRNKRQINPVGNAHHVKKTAYGTEGNARLILPDRRKATTDYQTAWIRLIFLNSVIQYTIFIISVLQSCIFAS